ncbi:MAG: methyltransferase domain-containing protein [Acidobacteriia bacterium]|nr:methyltransferase domain-containing protein [Terriglobia bacterium]
MRDSWNPETYHRFKSERSQPFHDLCAMLEPHPGMRAADLGCGPGDMTVRLHQQLAARETIGLDSSPNMLAQALPRAGQGLSFLQGRIEEFPLEGRFDLIFSNAALQWLEHHEALFEQFAARLAPGGQLAVQVPYNEESEFHRAARDVATEFREPLKGYVRHLVALSPEGYAHLLYRLGFTEQQVLLRIYPHVMESLDAVVEWYRGSLLTAYEARLDAPAYERFVARYREILHERYSDSRPFFFPFPRILLWGKMPGEDKR